jgi:pimeloyl-ACP methyl ester carboxylesterase
MFPIAASFLITNSRFRFPERGPRRPEDVGLPVEDARFAAVDSVALRGWWSPGESGRPVIIFVHGLNRSRLEMMERAAEAHHHGYGVFLFDLRNHGESGDSYTTLGIHEARDVCAAREAVRERAPGKGHVLWGVSMGAATSLLAVRDCGPVAGVVSDSAFISFRHTVAHHLRLYFHLPAFPIANLIVGITGLRIGIDPDSGDVEGAVRSFGKVPVLFIAGAEDRRMPPDVARRLFDAASSDQKRLLVIPGAGHGDAFREDRKQYLEAVFSFLTAASGPAGR